MGNNPGHRRGRGYQNGEISEHFAASCLGDARLADVFAAILVDGRLSENQKERLEQRLGTPLQRAKWATFVLAQGLPDGRHEREALDLFRSSLVELAQAPDPKQGREKALELIYGLLYDLSSQGGKHHLTECLMNERARFSDMCETMARIMEGFDKPYKPGFF